MLRVSHCGYASTHGNALVDPNSVRFMLLEPDTLSRLDGWKLGNNFYLMTDYTMTDVQLN